MRLPLRRRGGTEPYANARGVAASTPWREASWCALDLELTGLDARSDRIIAVGAVPIDRGRVMLGRSLYTLVRTARRSEVGAILTHKLRVSDLAQAPPLDEVLDRALELLTGRVPVFHAARIERAFLSPIFRRRGLQLPPAADTEALGRVWLRQRGESAPQGLPLSRLAQLLGQSPEPPHHALGDALTTAHAFIALASHLEAGSPQTVAALLSAEDQLRGARRFD